MAKKTSFQSIVIIRTDRIGEVLLSTVSIDAIKESYPDVKVSFVTSEYSRGLLENRQDIEEIFTVQTMTKKNWLKEAVRLALLLKKRRFDASIVLNPHKALHLACFLAGIPIRIGFDRKWAFLLNKKIPDKRNFGEKHEIEYTMELLQLLGVEAKASSPHLTIDKKAEERIDQLLRERNIILAKPIISIHPGSSNPAKMWSGEKYAELIIKIKKELDCTVIILGGKEEKTIADYITAKVNPGVVDLTGSLDLKELAVLLKKTRLFIGNDAGPMHMAAALGVSVIAIFMQNVPGASPTRWRPWGANHMVFHETPLCGACCDAACPYDYRCMQNVTVDAVFGAVCKKFS